MRKVVILGVGMTKFGKFLDTSLEEQGRVAIWNAIHDANIDPKKIQIAYVGNTLMGVLFGMGGQIGEVVLAHSGFSGIPIINVENACAGGTTALRGAWLEVASGNYDIALAVGVEKMYCADVSRPIKAMSGTGPWGWLGYQTSGGYAMRIRRFNQITGATREDFARVVEKNSYNGSLNPYAQHQKPLTVEQVLNSRLIADPLTLYMCCPIGDGAAATIVCTEAVARKYTTGPFIEIGAIALRSGLYRKQNEAEPDIDISTLAALEAYEKAGIGPEDIGVAEVHDAMAPMEIFEYEFLGFCQPGEGPRLIREGRTKITGDIPVNPSGGLAAKGHPIAATGLAQLAEIVWQLRGEAGERQIQNNPKAGLTQNNGGQTEFMDYAAGAVVVVKK